jgi:serine/threonine-protein kinase HipA
MKHCPITYDDILANEFYSQRGLKMLSPKLVTLEPLGFSAAEQRAEGIARVGKMSIQGVQAKFSAVLKVKECHFELVDSHGQYILKPQSEYYPEMPENEGLTMSLAALFGIEVPLHGMVYSKDNSMTYFVKRFDRTGHGNRLPLEDFAQLTSQDRDTKYNSSMEKVAKVLETFCSFPKIEAVRFFKLTLFNFIIGNEDMHLKNFSLISREMKIMISPAYDLLNTSIAQQNTKEELALPLNGKKNNLERQDFFDYLAIDVLKLNEKIIENVIEEIKIAVPKWDSLIERSFLTLPMKQRYIDLMKERLKRLDI